MSSFSIPPSNSRRFTGIYPGNFYGVLWRTFNVDFDRSEGKVGLSRRLTRVANTTIEATDTLGTIKAFLRTNADGTDRWWGLSDTGAGNLKRLFYAASTDPTSAWSADTITS